MKVAIALLFFLFACQPSLERQDKMNVFRPSDRFAPESPVRPMPTGTVPSEDEDVSAPPITRALLERGRERFGIYCAVCHGLTGNGNGIAVQRGFPSPGSFHTMPRRAQTAAHWFEVISLGAGAMPKFDPALTPPDRWAVIAFIRALQLSQLNAVGAP